MKKEMYKKGFVFGAVAILLTVALFTPLSAERNVTTISNFDAMGESEKNEKEKVYSVAIGPAGAKSLDECKVFNNLSEEEMSDLKESFSAIKNIDGLSTEEFVEKQLEVLRKYNILPKEFTIENIKNLVKKNDLQSNGQSLETQPDNPFYPYVRFLPTIYIYASFMSQYSYIDDMANKVPFYFNITRLNNLLEKIFNIDNPIFDFTKNISCGYYGGVTAWQIGIGGSIGFFSSFSPIEKLNYHFYGPFLGVFIFPITFLGIYIFLEVDDPDYPGGSFEIPYFDFMIGCPAIFSLVIPGWYVDPNQQPWCKP